MSFQAEMAIPVKPHTINLERQWVTPTSTEDQDGGQEPEVAIAWQVAVITTSFEF